MWSSWSPIMVFYAWVSPQLRVSKQNRQRRESTLEDKLSRMWEHEWGKKAAGSRVQGIRTSSVKRNSAPGCRLVWG